MLPSTSPRKVLFACSQSPPWNLPSSTVESTLSSPGSSSNLPLSRQSAALAHLDSLLPFDLVLWTYGSILFFLLAQAALSVALRPLFSFHQAQYAQVFLLKFANSLLVSAAPTSLPLLFSSYSALVLPLPSCSLLHLSSFSISLADLAGIVFFLLSLLFYLATMGPRTLVSPGERSG